MVGVVCEERGMGKFAFCGFVDGGFQFGTSEIICQVEKSLPKSVSGKFV